MKKAMKKLVAVTMAGLVMVAGTKIGHKATTKAENKKETKQQITEVETKDMGMGDKLTTLSDGSLIMENKDKGTYALYPEKDSDDFVEFENKKELDKAVQAHKDNKIEKVSTKDMGMGDKMTKFSDGTIAMENEDKNNYTLYPEKDSDEFIEFENKEDLNKAIEAHENNEVTEVSTKDMGLGDKMTTLSDGSIMMENPEKGTYAFYPVAMGDRCVELKNKNELDMVLETYKDLKPKTEKVEEFKVDKEWTQQDGDKVLEYNNGSTSVHNQDKGEYLFFPAELGDWEMTFDSMDDLNSAIDTYAQNSTK